MAIPGIQEVQSLATKYSKAQLQRMARMGLVDPTKAVMAGMMIDRIAKQNAQPPQTTVADDVLAPPPAQGGMPPQMGMPPQDVMPPPGIAGLPSGLPQQMAGGGIVAFADGGDTEEYAGGGVVAFADGKQVKDAGITDIIDPGWRSARTFKRNYSNDDKFAILAERLAELTAAERASAGEDKVRIQKDIEVLRSEMRNLKPSKAVSGLEALIPSAQAAPVTPPTNQPAAKKTSAPVDYYQDPLGVPYETSEGFSLKQQVTPGKPYEPSLQGLIFGTEVVDPNKLPPITPSKPAVEKPPTPPTTFAPKVEQQVPAVETPAPRVPAPSKETAPAAPSFMEKLRDIQIAVPKEKTIEQAAQEQEKVDTAMGVDKQLFDKLRQDFAETKGKFKDRADKAASQALLMFGLGLMGGRKGQEFQNASRAGQQALMMYMSGMDKITENEDKLNQATRELMLAEDQYKRSRSEKVLARIEKQQDKIDQINLENTKIRAQTEIKGMEFAIEDYKAKNPSQWKTIENIAKDANVSPLEVWKMAHPGLSGAQGAQISPQALADKAYDNVMKRAQVDIAFSMQISKDPNALQTAIDAETRRLQAGGAGGGGGGAFDYVPGKGLIPTK